MKAGSAHARHFVWLPTRREIEEFGAHSGEGNVVSKETGPERPDVEPAHRNGGRCNCRVSEE